MIDQKDLCSISRAESRDEWRSVLQEAVKHGTCGIVLFATDADPHSDEIDPMIDSIFLSLPNNKICIVDCLNLGLCVVGDLARLLEDERVKKVLYDAKHALAVIRVSENRKLNACNIFDLMLASQICWSGYYYLTPSGSSTNPWKKRRPDHSMASLAERHLGNILDDGGRERAAEESALLLPLHRIFAELLSRNGLDRVADLEFQAISSIAEMEITGIRMDCRQAECIVAQEENEICNLVWSMQDEARKKGFVTVSHDGKTLSYYLNPDRQEQVVAFLNKRGYALTSTRAEILRGLAAAGCSFAEALLRYRQISRNLVFLSRWLDRVDPGDGRVHPQYFQIPSSTGRISSRNPNAQQIPRAGEDAPVIRNLFSPASGKKYVKADFSAIELRIMAYLSGDSALLEAFQKGMDVHRLTASKISGKPFSQVTVQDRQAAKIMNFLLIYGGSARTLQWRILSDYGKFISLEEAEEAKDKFFESYEGVREWQEKQLSGMSYTVQHHFHNCVRGFFELPLTATTTALGRRRIWPRFGTGITATKFQIYNTPCQGTGADLIKLVMAEVFEKISSEEARIIGSIHDEILLEVPEEQAEEYAQRLKEIMERVGSELLYPVPVKAEVKVQKTLAG